MTSHQAKQKQASRRAIAAAALELTAERPHLDFSMRDVADRAEVSLRTVYNHFGSREDLLDGVLEHVNLLVSERGGTLIADVDSFQGVLGAIAPNFRIFAELGPAFGAVDRLDQAESPLTEDHDHRTRQMIDFVRAELDDPEDPAARVAAVLVRHLASHRTYRWLTAEYGLTTEEAIAAVRWGMQSLVDRAKTGDLPDPEANG